MKDRHRRTTKVAPHDDNSQLVFLIVRIASSACQIQGDHESTAAKMGAIYTKQALSLMDRVGMSPDDLMDFVDPIMARFIELDEAYGRGL